MKIQRTANAGVLLELDGVTFLLDGICPPYPPYLGTPPQLRAELSAEFPDVLAFTHRHPDHYDESYAALYAEKTLRPVYEPECSLFGALRGVRWQGIASRHIGKAEIAHASYIIEGSKCIWFLGDASPLFWKGRGELPRPDIAIINYAYAMSPASWRITKEWGAERNLLLHLPPRDQDEYGLWPAVEQTTQGDPSLIIPAIGETIIL